MEYPLTYDEYSKALAEGRLLGLRCNGCRLKIAPPVAACPNCGGSKLAKIELKPIGEIDTFTVIRVPPESFSERAPYIVARVRLHEGPLILGILRGVNPDKAGIYLIGREVSIKGAQMPGDRFSGGQGVVPVFTLAD